MLADFHFLRPEWLIALPIVLLAIFLLARRRLGAGNWRRVVSRELVPHVLSREPVSGNQTSWWLAALGAVLLITALAGPVWQRIEQPVFRSDQALVIALDLSRSMDAQDLSPSRLVRARLKILDILERRQDGQTALIVYSANAFTVTPLTTDTDTIASLVSSLHTDIMPSRGSYPVAAINKGRQLLQQAGATYGEILLITDGGSSPNVESTARELVDAGFRLSVLGVGTHDGAPIPLPNGGFVTNRSGEIAVPRLEERSLRALAEMGGGQYSNLTTDDSDLDLLLSGELGSTQAASSIQATDQWREEGPWLLLLLLPVAALSFRRGWVVVLALFLVPLPETAQADAWDDLWLTPDQQGQRALEEGNANAAAELFDDPTWRAAANYRAKDYANAAAGFADGDDATSLYNYGTSLARQGKFDGALDAFEESLALDPDNDDAKYNRDLVAKIVEQQQQSEQQEGEGEGGDSDQSEASDSESSESQDGQQSDSEDGDTQNRQEDPSEEDLAAMQEALEQAAREAENEAMTEEELAALRVGQEQEQAMEQWLRRIENDPGTLLERKFRYQYRQNRMDQDGNHTWPDDEVQTVVSLTKWVAVMVLLVLPVVVVHAEVRAGIDRANVEQNETFRLTIVSDAETDAEPDVSVLQQYFEVSLPETRVEARILNGQLHRNMSWTYTLMPKRPGQIIIPAISVGNEKTTPLIVTVSQVSAAIPGEAEVFVTSEVDYDDTYVQAQVLLRIKIFYSVPTRQLTLRDPTFSGVEVLVESAGDDRRYEAVINERPYQVIERVIAVFPQQSGQIDISPARFEARLLRNGRITGRKTYNSEALTVTVNPAPQPPAAHPNAAWLPALELEVEEDWSRDVATIKAGEPLTRHITIRALGQLETQIPALTVPAADGLNVYPDKPDLTRALEERGIRGQRRDQYALIGTQGGVVELPAIEVPWWNLAESEWQIATLPARTIEIEALPAPEVEATVVAADSTTSDGGGDAAEPTSPFWRRAAELLAAVWVATLALWWWTTRPVKAPREPAPVPTHKQQSRALKSARKAALANDATGVRAAMLEWSRLEWPDNPPLSIGALATRVSDPFASELQRLSRLSYGPADASWSGEAFAKALRSFATIDSQATNSDELLPPLTPGLPK